MISKSLCLELDARLHYTDIDALGRCLSQCSQLASRSSLCSMQRKSGEPLTLTCIGGGPCYASQM